VTARGAEPWLLDTNVLVYVLRGTALGRFLVEQEQLRARQQGALISVVTVGEILSLALKFGWGDQKQGRMRELLAEMVIVDINSEPVLSAYAEIDDWCRQQGVHPGKNDIWIAATTVATKAVLLTTDKDFDPLHEVFLERVYYDPQGSYPPE
jgi:tRNA(fMet)-specific endonuclease VapC